KIAGHYASAAITRGARAYEGAQGGRRVDGWLTSGGDADSVVLPSNATLRVRSRDLARNNGWAKRGIRAYETFLGGMNPRADTEDEELAERVDLLWKSWAEWADREGVTNFDGLVNMMIRHLVSDGEVLIRRRDMTLDRVDPLGYD
ncbi:phage portal protein, partial [Xanthomonas citri pv. citri]